MTGYEANMQWRMQDFRKGVPVARVAVNHTHLLLVKPIAYPSLALLCKLLLLCARA